MAEKNVKSPTLVEGMVYCLLVELFLGVELDRKL